MSASGGRTSSPDQHAARPVVDGGLGCMDEADSKRPGIILDHLHWPPAIAQLEQQRGMAC
jgi:hypothetical protein